MNEQKGEKMLANHPPAVKIAGRRLSVSNKPKPVVTKETSAPSTDPDETTPASPSDYPRPAPPHTDVSNTDSQESHILHRQEYEEYEEEDKDKKHGYKNLEKERKRSEVGHAKLEENRPTRDFTPRGKDHARIGQPVTKGLNI